MLLAGSADACQAQHSNSNGAEVSQAGVCLQAATLLLCIYLALDFPGSPPESSSCLPELDW